MNRDLQLYLEVYGEYQHLPRADAVKAVASKYNMAVSGVSGRVTRAHDSISNRVALLEYKQNHVPIIDPSAIAIQQIIDACNNARVYPYDETYQAVFMSDLHFPYADVRALRIVYDIISSLDNVRYISALNDALDLSALSRFDDDRTPKAQSIDYDLHNLLGMYTMHLDILSDIAPKAQQIAIWGNHDLRLGNRTLEAMQVLKGHGVLFLDTPKTLSYFEVDYNLVWGHGWKAASNVQTNLTANYNLLLNSLSERQTPDMIIGHTHRYGAMRLPNKKTTLINSGCLCRYDMHYLKYPANWNTGFVISTIDDDTIWHEHITIDTTNYTAWHNGKMFRG